MMLTEENTELFNSVMNKHPTTKKSPSKFTQELSELNYALSRALVSTRTQCEEVSDPLKLMSLPSLHIGKEAAPLLSTVKQKTDNLLSIQIPDASGSNFVDTINKGVETLGKNFYSVEDFIEDIKKSISVQQKLVEMAKQLFLPEKGCDDSFTSHINFSNREVVASSPIK